MPDLAPAFGSRPARIAVIDVQDKLLTAIPSAPALLEAVGLLLEVAQLLGVPATASEQYPRGLGPTAPAVRDRLLAEPAAKTAFSALAACGLASAAPADLAAGVVLVGVEAHVCVMQTAEELLARGVPVAVPADAVASRHGRDSEMALRRLERLGADVTTAEALVFRWLGDAAHPHFKAVSRLVVGRGAAR